MNTLTRLCILSAALLITSSALAEPRAYTNATIYGPDGQATAGATLVVDGAQIVAVGADVSPPADAELIDVEGATITAGFIDARSQLGLVEIWAVASTRDTNAADPVRAAYRARDAYNPDSAAIPIARRGGVTSVVTGPSGGLVSGQSAHCELAGSRVSEACADVPAALHINLGAGGGRAVGGSRGEVVLRLRELFDDARFLRTNEAAFDGNQSRALSAGRLDLKALWPALDGQIPVVMSVDRAADIEQALELATEFNLKLVILGGAEAWELADALAAAQIPVILDGTLNAPENFEKLSARADNAALLAAAGVPVVLGSFGVHNVRLLRQLAGNTVRAGLPWTDALAAVTTRPAEVFGLGASLGRLEPGYRANFVVWSGDPFELSTAVQRVVIGGVEQSLETRQSALFERYREL